jgi:hypothetical protein
LQVEGLRRERVADTASVAEQVAVVHLVENAAAVGASEPGST